MLFRMVSAKRSKSGSVIARKGIPKDVRAEYKRLYGAGWEAKLTVAATTSAHEAKIRTSEFLAEVETRIATIRAAQKGEGQSLSQRQAFALAGEWYVWYVGLHRENPGTPGKWNGLFVALVERLEDHAPDEVIERGWRDLDGWTRKPQVLEGIRPQIADEAKTAQFLASKGVILDGRPTPCFSIACCRSSSRRSCGSSGWRAATTSRTSGRPISRSMMGARQGRATTRRHGRCSPRGPRQRSRQLDREPVARGVPRSRQTIRQRRWHHRR